MGWPIIVIGLALLMVGIRGKVEEFHALLADDFGPNSGSNFIGWIMALLFIAAIGAYRPLRPISDGFLALIVIAILLSNQGFFARLEEQIR